MSAAQLPPFLNWTGRFIVVTGEDAHVAILSQEAMDSFYEGMRIAETRTRDPVTSSRYVLKQTFRCDAHIALPAFSLESVVFYMEHYEGRAQLAVQTMAALILTGQQFRSDQDDGGQRVRVTDLPHPPAPPTGAVFTNQGASA